MTNLPVKLAFNARIILFTAHRTNYTGPLTLNVISSGKWFRGITLTGLTGGVCFDHGVDSWIIREEP